MRAAGESVQRELQVLTLTRLWAKQVMGPYVKLTHGGTGRTQLRFLTRSTLSGHFSADRTDTSVFVREVLQCFTDRVRVQEDGFLC